MQSSASARRSSGPAEDTTRYSCLRSSHHPRLLAPSADVYTSRPAMMCSPSSGRGGDGDDASAHGRLAARGAGRKLDRDAKAGADPLLELTDVGDGDAERRRFRVHEPAMLGDGIREDGRLAQPAAGKM